MAKQKLLLIRSKNTGLHVPGQLYYGNMQYVVNVIENFKYLVQPGTYQVRLEYSPKFKKHLWELKGVPGRKEIKIHNGTHYKHSKGCILCSRDDLHHINSTLKNYHTTEIQIKNP